jgi:outer membrane cobalamin receptor
MDVARFMRQPEKTTVLNVEGGEKMKTRSSGSLVVLGMLFMSVTCWAQTNDGIASMTIEELMSIRVTSASRRPELLTEASGILTVISRKEIERSGARDLMEILETVPGIHFGNDISGLIGIGFRGVWANEGKVLLLIDGLEMNEEMYSSWQYGQHIPAEMIEQIEVIRGPGSAVYGGSAELGVISVTTRSGVETDGLLVAARYGLMDGTVNRQNGTVIFGGADGDFSYSLLAHIGRGNRSDRTATDLWGWSHDLGEDDSSRISALFVNGFLQWRNLSCRLIADRYEAVAAYQYYDPYKTHFNSYMVEMKHDLPVTDDLNLISRVQYKRNEPWCYPEVTYDDGSYKASYQNNISSEKLMVEICADYAPADDYSLLAGVSYDAISGTDHARQNTLGSENSASYGNAAAYAQAIFDTRYGKIVAGCRYAYHEEYGASFVPRITFARSTDSYHVKLLASEAYRAPSIMNIAYNNDITPERASVYEVEAGARVTDHTYLTANFFDTRMADWIVYAWSEETGSTYNNHGNLRVRGLESTVRYKEPWGSVDLVYSLSHVTANDVADYAVPGTDASLLGFPQHKLSLRGSVAPWAGVPFYVTPTVTFVGQRYAITGIEYDAGGGENMVYTKEDGSWLVDCAIVYKGFADGRLGLSFAVHNILDEDYAYIEPYLGYESPLPTPSRQFSLGVEYEF